MFIKLTKQREIKGVKRNKGALLVVSDALGERLILGGLATPTTREAYEKSIKPKKRKTKAQTLKEYRKLNYEF